MKQADVQERRRGNTRFNRPSAFTPIGHPDGRTTAEGGSRATTGGHRQRVRNRPADRLLWLSTSKAEVDIGAQASLPAVGSRPAWSPRGILTGDARFNPSVRLQPKGHPDGRTTAEGPSRATPGGHRPGSAIDRRTGCRYGPPVKPRWTSEPRSAFRRSVHDRLGASGESCPATPDSIPQFASTRQGNRTDVGIVVTEVKDAEEKQPAEQI